MSYSHSAIHRIECAIGGAVTDSQLFTFNGGSGPLPLVPQNGNNQTILTINNNLLDQTSGSPDKASGNEVGFLFQIAA